MSPSLGRRKFLTQAGMALAAVETIDHFSPCCALAADAATAEKDLFELKKVGDGVYAAIAAPRFKTNCNAAVILTNDGVIVVDSHSKPSAAAALQREIQSVTKMPVRKTLAERLAPKYEQRMSKHPVGQYRERVGTNIEMVYRKVVQKA